MPNVFKPLPLRRAERKNGSRTHSVDPPRTPAPTPPPHRHSGNTQHENTETQKSAPSSDDRPLPLRISGNVPLDVLSSSCHNHGRQETNRHVCAPEKNNRLWFLPQCKNSEPVENRQVVAHGPSRPGTDVPGRGKVVEPVLGYVSTCTERMRSGPGTATADGCRQRLYVSTTAYPLQEPMRIRRRSSWTENGILPL